MHILRLIFQLAKVLGGYCECVEMYDTGILDLDHENDFELMQVIANYLYKNNSEFRVVADNIDCI